MLNSYMYSEEIRKLLKLTVTSTLTIVQKYCRYLAEILNYYILCVSHYFEISKSYHHISHILYILCIYVCVYVCTYVHVYVCLCVGVGVGVCVHVYVCMCLCTVQLKGNVALARHSRANVEHVSSRLTCLH